MPLTTPERRTPATDLRHRGDSDDEASDDGSTNDDGLSGGTDGMCVSGLYMELS